MYLTLRSVFLPIHGSEQETGRHQMIKECGTIIYKVYQHISVICTDGCNESCKTSTDKYSKLIHWHQVIRKGCKELIDKCRKHRKGVHKVIIRHPIRICQTNWQTISPGLSRQNTLHFGGLLCIFTSKSIFAYLIASACCN